MHLQYSRSRQLKLIIVVVVFAISVADPTSAQCPPPSSCPDVCNPSIDCDPGEYCSSTKPTDWCKYPTTGCASGRYAAGNCCAKGPTPILVDVNGDGFSLTDLIGGVYFAIGPTDFVSQVAWPVEGSDDAWLVLDRNGNGVIDNGLELFGDSTEQPPVAAEVRNGYRALAVFDQPADGGNADGWINAADQIFASLRLWQDRNHNGLSDGWELFPLPSLGVEAMNLHYRESRRVDAYGNLFRYLSMARIAGGGTRRTTDVILLIGDVPR